MRDLVKEIGSTLRGNKLRTALTGFAVSWGIFLIICLLGAGNGLINALLGNMDDFVQNSMRVQGWRTSKPYAGYKEGRFISLDEKDVLLTESPAWSDHIDKVSKETGRQSTTLSRREQTITGVLVGVTEDYRDMNKVNLVAGRFINPIDLRENRKVMVVGSNQAKVLSPGKPEGLIGQWVAADGIFWQVVGIYQTDESSYTRVDYVPYSTIKHVYGMDDKVSAILFTFHGLETLKENEAFEKQYGRQLKVRHDDPNAIWILNRYTQNIQMSKAQRIIRTALWVLGLLTLISGIVGVSNIMLISVKERTHEFGIRKAIGARPREILKLIIAESVTITALFGYVGMVLGMLACEIMDKTIGQRSVDIGFTQLHMLENPSVGLDVALEATLLLIVAGTLAGLAPALRASRVRPIEALRAE